MKKWRPSGSVSWTQLSGSTGTAPPPLKSEVLLLKEDAGLPTRTHKMGELRSTTRHRLGTTYKK